MGWYNASWDYRVKITVDNTKVDADLTDFPVYVNLANLPAEFFTNVKSDGADIRVTKTDGTTEVPREVVFITVGSSIGELHFKASGTLSSSTDTDYYIYYGNAGASEPAVTDTYGRNNVWTGFETVWHLQEDPGGSAPQMIDSTGNNTGGTSNGSMSSGNLVPVKVEDGLDFDGTNDYIGLNTSFSLGNVANSSFNVSAWIKPDVVNTNNQQIVDESGTTVYGGGLELRVNSSAKIRFWQQDAVNNLIDSTTSLSAGTTYHVAGAFVGTSMSGNNYLGNEYIYLNGTQDNSRSSFIATTTRVRNAANPNIGRSQVLGGYFNGYIDEVRTAISERSADWIKAEYNNQSSPATFYTAGSEEANAVVEDNATFFGMEF